MNPNNYTVKKDLLNLALLLAIAAIAYWPLTFHLFSLKNDALNYFLPVRWQISEAINNGHFPFWSPYINLGYCLHGDMQSGVWNPFVWLFSLAGPYSLYTLQLETLLYVLLSGSGMYMLLKYSGARPSANMMCSTAYMLCGYTIDSSQFLHWICSAALLPYITLFYYRTLKENKTVDYFLAGIFFISCS